jgi:23S rRNA (pseudouridine1915-N3)-methyltransferase
MKLHLVTIGRPKLQYAKLGWEEYLRRLEHYHRVQVTHIADKQNDSAHLLKSTENSFRVALTIEGPQFSSQGLAIFLNDHSLNTRAISFMIGGPEGLPEDVIKAADAQWSFSQLTFPHDLAMVVLVETLYRASTINTGHPYHK